MAPAKFIDGVPHVYWKYSFDWRSYDYNNPSSDDHNHFGYGHKVVPCKDSTDKFMIYFNKGKGLYRGCAWLGNKKIRKKCAKFRELQIRCPVTCKVEGC